MRWAWLALVVASCFKDTSLPCGDLLCPFDAVCADDRCIPREALETCDGIADGEPCKTTHIMMGSCRTGECRAAGCGNGTIEPGEVCDDGNVSDGDACSAQCDEVDTCPPIGQTPHYSDLLHQPFLQDCTDYNEAVDQNLAVAICDRGIDVSVGPTEGPLIPVPILTSSAYEYSQARLAPEGDRIFVLRTVAAGSPELQMRLRGNDDWTTTTVITSSTAPFYGLSPPTRGPLPHIMVPVGSDRLVELVIDDSGVATTAHTIDAASMGVDTFDGVATLAPDGLRMVFVASKLAGGGGSFYTDRPSIDADFRQAEKLIEIPGIEDSHMTANCGRIYFSAIGSVFYVQQR